MKAKLYPYKPEIKCFELIFTASLGLLGVCLLILYLPGISEKSNCLDIWMVILGFFSVIFFIFIIEAMVQKFIKISANDFDIRYYWKKMQWKEMQSVKVYNTTITQNGYYNNYKRSLLFKNQHGKSLKIPFFQRNLLGEVTYQHDLEIFEKFLGIIEQRFCLKSGSLKATYEESNRLNQQQIRRYGFPFSKMMLSIFGKNAKDLSSGHPLNNIKSLDSSIAPKEYRQKDPNEFHYTVSINKKDSEQERVLTFKIPGLNSVQVKIPRGIKEGDKLRLSNVGDKNATIYLIIKIDYNCHGQILF